MKHSLSKLVVAGLILSAGGIAVAADLTAGQVKGRLEAAGYTDVRNIHREGNHFDAKATDRAGKEVSGHRRPDGRHYEGEGRKRRGA